MTDIRQTADADEPVIRAVHELAFGPYEGPTIADLTIALLNDPTAEPVVSLLAYEGPDAIGHILFTRVRVPSPDSEPIAHILAPLAVVPDHQRQGIGAKLIQRGLKLLTQSGSVLVFVLGHPEYYPRFGFAPAGRQGLDAPYPIPEKNADAWMVHELIPGTAGKVGGTLQCADALNRREYWIE